MSLSAVSLVLNGKTGVSAEKRERVLAAMESLNYVHAPRQSRQQPVAVLGLVMERLSATSSSDGFMAEVVSGIEDGARRADLRLLTHVYQPGTDPVGDMRALMGRDVDGLVVANGGDISSEAIGGILGTGVPTVLLENYVDAPCHAVVADNVTAGLVSTRHLLDLGHQRIGMLVGSSRYVSLVDRRRGYIAALVEAGTTPLDELMPLQEPHNPRKGYAQMKRLLALEEPPTAVYAVSDKSAFGALEAVREAGLRVPEDISIVGTDDVAESAYSSPPLTTFHIPKSQLGEQAVRVVQQLLGAHPVPPSRLVLQGRLVRRSSSAPPPVG